MKNLIVFIFILMSAIGRIGSAEIAADKSEIKPESFNCYIYASELKYYKSPLDFWPSWGRFSFPGDRSIKMEQASVGLFKLPKNRELTFHGLDYVEILFNKEMMVINTSGMHKISDLETSTDTVQSFNAIENIFKYSANRNVEFKPWLPKVGVRDTGIQYRFSCSSKSWYIE